MRLSVRGICMPAASQGVDEQQDDWSEERALRLLEQALEIVDHWNDNPALGARLQQVVDEIEERRRSS